VTAPEIPIDVLDTPEAGGLVVRGGALRVGSFALGTALSVLGVVAMTRHLGAVDYGRYQTVIALGAIVAALADTGLNTLALREHAQAPAAERERLLDTLLGLRVVLTVVGVPVTAGIAVLLGYDTTMVGGAALVAGAWILNAVQQTEAVPLQTTLRQGAVAALELGRQAASTVLIVVLVLAGAGVLSFLAVPIVCSAAVLIATAPLVGGLRRPRLDRERWPGLVRAGGAVGLASAAGIVYLYTSLLVCELVATPTETGWFSASFRVVIIVAAVPVLLGTSAFPLLARAATHAPERFGRVASGLLEGSVLLGGAAALGAILGAPAIIAVLAGSGFDAAIAPLRLQGAALGLTFAIAALGFTLLARHRHRALVAGNALGFLTSAVAVALLGAAYGERGAAGGAALGEVVLCTALAVMVLRDVPLRPARLPRILLALAGGLAVGWLAPLPSVPATVVGMTVYGGLALVLGAVAPDLRAAVAPAGAGGRRPTPRQRR
jgi:O-antigen/teichoic acid export membrane protein